MSITFLCLVRGEPITRAFAIDIDSNMLISYLKKVVKSELHPQFDNVPHKDIKLWKIEIRDNNIGALSNLSLHDNDELLPTRKVKEYWPKAPEEEHIHIIVSLSTSFNLSIKYFHIKYVEKGDTHRTFYKMLDNISNNQTIQQKKLEYAFIEILATTCWLRPDRGELYPQQVILASTCWLRPDKGKYTLGKFSLEECFL
ncbi:18912_t:CDS:2 [Gigaspora margarita]|uniref:18912_t:CDS:1 n=1 Tax=Gigaspora margarita TaxID=4874 RepID=A0ABN7WAZ5_GIGMA|nr:18912_t:CDS:2 [Gigaspora margarita]